MNKTLLGCVLLVVSSAAYGASQQAVKSFILIDDVQKFANKETIPLGVVAQYESKKSAAVESLKLEDQAVVPLVIQRDKVIQHITVTQYNTAYVPVAMGSYAFTPMDKDVLGSGKSVCVIRYTGKKDDKGRGVLAITVEDTKKFGASGKS